MATTTNFGWTTPDDTDLVKDGASAIRTLGSAIDTSLVDLKGGTTGQVLAKASDTDMDFTWSSVDPLTILDAKADLITATAADTPARLAVGANGTVLTADSGETTGLKWATPSAGGFTLLATATLSGTGTFTFSSISGDYTHLFISVIDLYGSANDAEYKMQFNQDSSGNHSDNGLHFNGTSVVQTSERGATSFGNGGVQKCPIQRMYTSAGDFGDISARSSIWIWNYASTTLEKQVSWTAGGNARYSDFQGLWNSTSAITRIDFIPYAATTATGTVLLYGVK